MKINPTARLSLCGLALILWIAPGGRAQNAGVRVARLSRADGQVLISQAGSNIWEDAPVNLPLQEGDSLATQNGRAEIEFDNGATASMAENSVLQFTRLGFSANGSATDLTLAQGAAAFHADVANPNSFRVQALTFNVTVPQSADFRIDGFQDGATIQVFSGSVSVSTTKGSTNLEKGQSVAVSQKDFQQLSIIDLQNPEDAFNQWVIEQGEMIRAGNKNTLNYISPQNVYGLSDLSRYGTWVNVAGFGYSWRPFSVGFTWTPYLNGHWVLNPLLGWVWVSGESWGWTPYHFGSWLLSPNLGWVWVPGGASGLQQWQGSRVNWVHVGNQVGWVAKSPNDREGVPANAAHGVVVRMEQPAGKGNGSNQILSGKNLENLATTKEPLPEFALRTGSGAPHSGIQSTIRISPFTMNNNPSIVSDRGTRTYVHPGRDDNSPVSPAPPMPAFNPEPQVPRATPPSSFPPSRGPGRLFVPPAPPVTRGNVPVNGVAPVKPPTGVPLNVRPRIGSSPPASTPRPSAPQPALSPPHAAPSKTNSTSRPSAETPRAALAARTDR